MSALRIRHLGGIWILAIALGTILGVSSGCGQKGGLYLPEDQPPEEPSVEARRAPSAPADPLSDESYSLEDPLTEEQPEPYSLEDPLREEEHQPYPPADLLSDEPREPYPGAGAPGN